MLSDALTASLGQAVRRRGGYPELRCKSAGKRQVSISIEVTTTDSEASYDLELDESAGGGVRVLREECRVVPASQTASTWFRRGAELESSEPLLPLPSDDRLYLVTAAGLPAFRRVYDALTGMRFYNVQPDTVREPQVPDPGDLLASDGRNAASVLRRMADVDQQAKGTVQESMPLSLS